MFHHEPSQIYDGAINKHSLRDAGPPSHIVFGSLGTMRILRYRTPGQGLAPSSVRGLSSCHTIVSTKIATSSGRKVVVPSRDRVIRPHALLGGLGKMLRGDPAKKTQERLQPIVDQVNTLESGMQSKTDDELRAMTKDLQKRAQSGTSLDSLLPEAFAVRRTFSCVIPAFHAFHICQHGC